MLYELAHLGGVLEAGVEGMHPRGAVLWLRTRQEQDKRGGQRAGISSTGSGIEPAGVLKLRSTLPSAIETT